MSRKQKRTQRIRHPKVRPSKRQRQQVLTLTAAGKNRELVASQVGESIAKLRTRYAGELDKGRKLAADRKAEEARDQELSEADFHFLDVCTDSFSDNWCDETDGTNLVFRDVDGNGARTVEDAYAGWKARGGKWNCTGLSSSKFDPDKVAAFAKIVAEHRNKQTEER